MAALEQMWQAVNWIDLVLCLGLVAAFLVGIGMGFYRQLAIVASLILGWLLASQLTQPLAASEFFSPMRARYGTSGSEFLAFSGLILGSVLIGLLSILIFRSYFHKTVRVIDAALGGVTGVGIGALVFGLCILALFHWEETWLHQPLRESYLGSRLAEGARVASTIFPEEYRRRVEASLSDRISTLADSPPQDATAGAPGVGPAGSSVPVVDPVTGLLVPAAAVHDGAVPSTPGSDGSVTPASAGAAEGRAPSPTTGKPVPVTTPVEAGGPVPAGPTREQ